MSSEKHLIVTHRRPQVSDLLYIYLVKNFATEETHRGVSNGVEVEFIENDNVLKDENGKSLVPLIESMDEAADISFCGRGGGMYDEHGKDILDCEATLVGKSIGLLRELGPNERAESLGHLFEINDGKGRKKRFAVRDPKMRDLFAVVARDDIRGSQPYSLGNMIDLMHWQYPDDPEKVMRWAFRLFGYIRANGPFSKEDRERGFYRGAAKILLYALDCVGKFSGMEKEYHSKAKRNLGEWLNKRRENPQWQALDMIDASAIMLNQPGEDLFDWPLDVIIAEVERQHHFHTITAEEAKKAELIDVKILIKDGTSERVEDRKIAMVASDDLDVHKYLSAVDLGYYAVCVIKQNSRGQVQIFPGNFSKEVRRGEKIKIQQLSYSFPMPYVAAAVREAEYKAKNKPVPSWYELISDRGAADEKTWFYYSGAGWLMNGSLTMADVRPTEVLFYDLAEITRIGFDADCAGYKAAHLEQLKLR